MPWHKGSVLSKAQLDSYSPGYILLDHAHQWKNGWC